ncbi:MAG TPA: ice-binding family protein [Pedobacter sp.]|uniref:ice-binding family protein n=1 Tax=Pedobacter sp. TaxID=1411316 RepID=UPI002D16B2E1|nr:ice-binding family protein [Pedobacter sp.]HMI02270.1 ice-binding family protein [Pedobacter sp.]
MKAILAGFLLVFTGLQLNAQTITNYAFAANNGTFTALSAPVSTSWTGDTDTGLSGLIPLGFNFWYMGVRYINVVASTNGWLALGPIPSGNPAANNLSSGGSPRPIIAPFWDDLDIMAFGNVTYQTTGTAGSKILTVQYLNTKWGLLALGGTCSFQVKFHEGTGIVEFIYRPEATLVVIPSVSVGITGIPTGSGNFLSVNNAGTSVSSTAEANVTTKPVSGKTYTFTPPVPTAPGSLTFSGLSYTGMTLNWTDLSSNENGFVIYRSADGISYSLISQTAAGATSSVQTGLNINTTYYWKVYAVSEGALSAALSGSQSTGRVNAPALGSAVNFTFYTISGAVGNTGISNVTGNSGTNVGAITGFEISNVIGTMHIANAQTTQAMTDLQAACVQIDAIAPTATHGPVLGNGEILFPGAYTIAAAGSVATTLTLDGQGDPNAVFIFKIGGALTTGAATTVNLVNGATACNVFWKAEGAVAMAASTVMKGTVIANNGAISMAAGGTLEGRMFSTLGAVTVDGVSASIPRCACTPAAPVVSSPIIYCQNSTATALTATGTNLVWGSGSLVAPVPSTTTIGSVNYAVTQTVGGCLSLPATIIVTVTPGPSATITYAGSPYRSDVLTAAVTRSGTAGGTYSSTAGLSVNPVSGLVDVQSSVLGSYTVTYTIAAGSGCNQYQTTTGIAIVPPPSVNLGTAANFTLFTNSGAVGNTGVSNITGDIGTNLGAITGFEISVVAGNMYTANSVTVQCAADVLSAYNQLNSFSPTAVHGAVLGNGEVLYPGIYNLAAAASVAAVLTLDAQGDASALFVFKIGGAFTTGAGTTVNLINGASACNVYWKVEGAIALGASTSMAGTLIANNGAASIAAGGTLKGRLFSTLGAIAIDALSSTVAICVSGASWTGAVSTDWHLADNWLNGTIPSAATNTIIPPGSPYHPVLNTGTGLVKNITVQSSASLTVTGATLQINGVISNSGLFNLSAGTIKMNGTAAQIIPSSTFTGGVIKNLTINNAAGVTLGGALNLSGILLVSNGLFNTGSFLTLASSAAQTALIDGTGTGSVSGNVTMQRYLVAGYGYKYFSSPVQSATVNSFAGTVDLNASFPNFYTYIENQASSGFTSYTALANPLVPMHGYAADFGASTIQKTVSIAGAVNDGTISTTIYNHNQPYSEGFNLVGNPYPSPIDWNAASGWIKTNIDNAVYFFNSGTTSQYTGSYSTYINGVSSDGIAGNIIASMQGFFVHVSNGSYPVMGTLGVNNQVRVNNLSPVFHKSALSSLPTRDPQKPRILLRLSANFSDQEQSSDPLIIYTSDQASAVFDKNLDAIKLMNLDDQLPNLYSLAADASKLVINVLPELDTLTVIPLGLQTGRNGAITFNLRSTEEWPNALHIYLMDAVTGTKQDLLLNPRFTVSLNQGVYNGRFSLRFTELNASLEKKDEYSLYGSGGSLFIHIKLISEQKGYLLISNMTGQLISRQPINGNGDYELHHLSPAIVYIVSFITPKGTHTKKVLIGGDK